MKYIVAVSGGVDSMVLLHKMISQHGPQALVVAHFDHGMRRNSHEDAQFVRKIAEMHGCQFEVATEELGGSASEELARVHRYAFLHDVARRFSAPLVVAHHLDDLIETVALQIIRGTGWRGLTPFGQNIERPLLDMTKEEIIAYAQNHQIAWREDGTNLDTAYARNRIRPAVNALTYDIKRQVAALYAQQWSLRREIEGTVQQFIEGSRYSRYFFIMTPSVVRVEILRSITEGRLTRPQLLRLAHAICVTRSKKTYEAGSGVKIYFTTRHFTVELLKLDKDI